MGKDIWAWVGMEDYCQHCGKEYEIDYHLNDNFCSDCREELNREVFDNGGNTDSQTGFN